jgi:hypothetical protein
MCFFLFPFFQKCDTSAGPKSCTPGNGQPRVDQKVTSGGSGTSGRGSGNESGSRNGGGSDTNGEDQGPDGAGSGGGAGDGPNDGRDAPDSEDGDDEDEEDVADDNEENDENEDAKENETDEDLQAGSERASVVGSSVRGSPAPAEQGNWMSFEELMNETYPAKSNSAYLAAYAKFEQYLKSLGMFDPKLAPTETCLLNYFHHLKTVKHWASTSIWSQYSRLNAVLKRRFRVSLKSYPSVTDLLKSYEVGHRLKKSSVFSPQQDSLYILKACH